MKTFSDQKQAAMVRAASTSAPTRPRKRTYRDLSKNKLAHHDAKSISILGLGITFCTVMTLIFPGTFGWILGVTALVAFSGWSGARLVALPLTAFQDGMEKWAIDQAIEEGKDPDIAAPSNSLRTLEAARKNITVKHIARLALRQPVAIEILSQSPSDIRWEDTPNYMNYHRDRRRAQPYSYSEKRQWLGYEKDLRQKWETSRLINATTRKDVIIARGAKVGVVSWSEDSDTKRWLASVDNALQLADI